MRRGCYTLQTVPSSLTYYLDTSGNFPLNHEDTWFQPPETDRSKLYKPTILLDIIMIIWKSSSFFDKKKNS